MTDGMILSLGSVNLKSSTEHARHRLDPKKADKYLR